MAPVSVGGVNASVNPTMLSNHREVVTVVADTVTEQCDARWSGAGWSRVEPGRAGRRLGRARSRCHGANSAGRGENKEPPDEN